MALRPRDAGGLKRLAEGDLERLEVALRIVIVIPETHERGEGGERNPAPPLAPDDEAMA
jgi:hypothetical protein